MRRPIRLHTPSKQICERIDLATTIQQDGWIIANDAIVTHIHVEGLWVRDLYNELSDI
jgi:hypothetical protein